PFAVPHRPARKTHFVDRERSYCGSLPSGAVLLQVRPALGALQPKLIDKVNGSFPGVTPGHLPVRFSPPSWTFSLHKATGSFQEF
ncbi:hypothetical protein, partial [Phyllobacterium chamaecytisi]|uniref:hypothetical protein n=1 Tax=Phyllobacterium chamaecytisi TaxID=2876082 RepID=UPI001CCC3B0B